ncbi:MAG: cyclic nucleotide-binding domain-containing protein [Deltaproteobacteria bacterium]|nr:cyclic nucleotide-binding domain-containing protein [Deltaproteobacteria bacterium]
MDAEQLKKMYLFEGLDEDGIAKIAAICKEETFKAGDRIFNEGDKGDKLYMVLSGEVRISKMIPGVGEEALAMLKEGSFFGEMALIDDIERSTHAIANKATKCATISRGDFEQLLFVDEKIATPILWTFVRTLSSRLRETNEKIKAFFAMTGGFK